MKLIECLPVPIEIWAIHGAHCHECIRLNRWRVVDVQKAILCSLVLHFSVSSQWFCTKKVGVRGKDMIEPVGSN